MKKKTGKPEKSGNSKVDFGEVTRMLDFMAEHGLQEFEYDGNGFRVHLKKAAAPVASPRSEAAQSHTPTASPSRDSGSPAAKVAEDLHIVKSPIVGTYYASATPGAEPFVKVGSTVAAGQTLCIIEAMKLMNEIESDVAGEVVEVIAVNGQPVEYGESLFAIRPKK